VASFLGGLKMLRAVEGFAVTYWYYAQIDAIARTGSASIVDLAVQGAAHHAERRQGVAQGVRKGAVGDDRARPSASTVCRISAARRFRTTGSITTRRWRPACAMR
jgi:hypothetical protein